MMHTTVQRKCVRMRGALYRIVQLVTILQQVDVLPSKNQALCDLSTMLLLMGSYVT